MAKQLQDLTYEEWLAWVFDHPVTGPEWYFDLEADFWDEERDPELTVDYLTRLFERPGVLTPTYSDAQINQGLWFLASPSCSNHLFTLLTPAVPWAKRERGIRSIAGLNRELFAPRGATYFSHLDDGPEPSNPLNSVCYMWWDLAPLPTNSHYPDRERTDAVILEVLRATLALPSAACQEGALHGLGHFSLVGHRRQVERIIDAYLPRRDLHPELRKYALQARTGCVL